ncbi:cytochrome c oxidase subunit 3, partial [Tanacetum coccineum]
TQQPSALLEKDSIQPQVPLQLCLSLISKLFSSAYFDSDLRFLHSVSGSSQQDLSLMQGLLMKAFSHSSLAPTVEIGGIWPPKGIAVLDPQEIPFLNTLIPLSSGAAITWAHHAILAGKEKRAVYALVATVSLALVFTAFQGMEYYQAPSIISDSWYEYSIKRTKTKAKQTKPSTRMEKARENESNGTLFSIICGIRQYLGHLTKEHHVGFEAAAWDRRDYGRSCSPRNDPKLDLGLFEIVPFNRNQRCFLVSRFFSEQIEEPNGSNSSLAATKEIGLALRKERSALS